MGGNVRRMSMSGKTWDAVVVGGGPAGLAAAIAMQQRGLSCMVADAMAPPIDKACGEGLMPDALDSLGRLGVQMDASEGGIFRGIRFQNQDHCIQAEFPRGRALGVRRKHLHARMVERAEESGVALRWGTRAEMRPGQPLRLNGSEVKACWIIGADGQTSRFRAWAGLDAVRSESRRYGFRRHYRVAPWSEMVEVHWGDRGQIYVTPVAADEVCVAWVTRDPRRRLDDALRGFPFLQSKLRGAEATSRERGCITTTRTLKRLYRGQHVLLGDASGSADAITGEGLAISFRQSLALADAIAQNDLAEYAQAHRSIARLPQMMARTLLLMDRFTWLQERAISVFAAEPQEFAQMLAMHVGEVSLGSFALRNATRIALKLLAGGAKNDPDQLLGDESPATESVPA